MKRVLVIVPHPDDAEFHAGGLIASFISEGAKVHIITATDGRCGTYQYSAEEISTIRSEEARKAAAFLGATLEWLGYPDFDLDSIHHNHLREQLVRSIRSFKPDVIIAEDPYQKDQVHPDHRYLAFCASDAIHFAQLPNVYPSHQTEGLMPHFVTEKFFYTEDPSRMNKIVDVTPYLQTKMDSMGLHQSQVEFLVQDVMQQAQAAGIDLQNMAGESIQDPFQALSFAMMAQMAEVGKLISVPFAEGYHYMRFHPFIENLLQDNPIS
jgi:LmbE family N-acetylglucosaminyl deacetylase